MMDAWLDVITCKVITSSCIPRIKDANSRWPPRSLDELWIRGRPLLARMELVSTLFGACLKANRSHSTSASGHYHPKGVLWGCPEIIYCHCGWQHEINFLACKKVVRHVVIMKSDYRIVADDSWKVILEVIRHGTTSEHLTLDHVTVA